ncbi:hypothetical protein BKA57DRAFT_466647 [Linnemannia elongata]|nr:hypothetical protein BKA57DRAFT_466647 [Linnemannia elongata]
MGLLVCCLLFSFLALPLTSARTLHCTLSIVAVINLIKFFFSLTRSIFVVPVRQSCVTFLLLRTRSYPTGNVTLQSSGSEKMPFLG